MTFLDSLKAHLRKEKKSARVVWLGLDFAGKTTLIRRVIDNTFEANTRRTLGLKVDEFSVDNMKLVCWDVGGQVYFREALWGSYINGCNAVVFVIDSSQSDRFPEAHDELWGLVLSNPNIKNIPLLILANKQDLPAAADSGKIALALELDKLKHISYAIFPCSARTGDKVLEGMEWIQKRIIETNK